MRPFDAALLASTLVLTAPILLAALGELVSERAGVLNVGLEGMMLAGAFAGFWAAWASHHTMLGLVAGALAGVGLGVVMALLCVEAGADQIVAGVGINLLALGGTTFAFDQIFGSRAQVVLNPVADLKIPLLSDLGGVGKALFSHDPLLYVIFGLVPLTWFFFYRTRWGLSLRAVGELPVAAETAGVSVRRVRWMAILTAGFAAGLAGASLSVIHVGIFRQEMSAGRGFLALAAVIFGRWRPGGLLLACLFFGGADALELRLQGQSQLPASVWAVIALIAAILTLVAVRRWRRDALPARGLVVGLVAAGIGLALTLTKPHLSIPSQLWLALPFLLALTALARTVGKVRVPSALTLPYRRGET